MAYYSEDLTKGKTYLGTPYSGYSIANAFDDNNSSIAYTTGTGGNMTKDTIGVDFGENVKISKVRLLGDAYMCKDFDIQYSNDNSNWITCFSGTLLQSVWGDYNIGDNGSHRYWRVFIKSTYSTGVSSGLKEIEMMKLISDSLLIYNNNQYKKYSTSWQIVTSSNPTESDYLNGNTLEELSLIPESAWQELTGTVELCFYTDDVSKTEVEFKIETEPFTFYDEMGDNIEILYYTDDLNKTNSNLEITHNHSVLDDLDGDFDVVTYTDNTSITDFNVNVNALPIGQIVVENQDLELYGNLSKLVVDKLDNTLAEGVIRFGVSTDGGNNWKSYKNGSWNAININSKDSLILDGMSISDLANIDSEKLSNNSSIRLCYYIEEHVSETNSAKVKSIDSIQSATISSPRIEDGAFYIVNTVSTINLTLIGSTVSGKIDDIDHGKVRYKVILNNNKIYPENSDYTDFASTPLDIKLRIDHSKLLIDAQNSLRVEIQDYWGATDYWETTFIGEYSGLMFKSPTNEYYSDEVGNILKYLDMGTIIAGQVSQDFEIRLRNSNGFDVENIIITPSTEAQGVTIELGKTTNPFVAESELSFAQLLDGDEVSFYVRILTDYSTPSVSGALFQLRVDSNEITP